ncbi:uncharacterized protein LOC134970048 [Pseudophryne corroboree]|uniref:uncharacterized protein LOC134970048 n=1 Tax=Pseudophryne corroboree TaxID=495146 RepID=UPI003081E3DA
MQMWLYCLRGWINLILRHKHGGNPWRTLCLRYRPPQGHINVQLPRWQDTDTDKDSDSSVDFNEATLHPKVVKSIQYMIVAIKDVLYISEEPPVPDKRVCLYKGKKPEVTFPPSHELNALCEKAWELPDKRWQIPKRILTAYSFRSDREKWESSPNVDKALSRLSKKVALLSPDTAALKDPADRKQETTLKAIFVTTGALLRPAVASAWVICVVRDITKRMRRGILASWDQEPMPWRSRPGGRCRFINGMLMPTPRNLWKLFLLKVVSCLVMALLTWCLPLLRVSHLFFLMFPHNRKRRPIIRCSPFGLINTKKERTRPPSLQRIEEGGKRSPAVPGTQDQRFSPASTKSTA